MKTLTALTIILLVSGSLQAQWSTGSNTVYTNNNIGVGTSSPLGILDVNMSNWIIFRNNVGLMPKPNASANYGLAMAWNPSSGDGESVISYGKGLGGKPRLSFSSFNGTTLTEEMTLKNGRLGMGTNDPIMMLDVRGDCRLERTVSTVLTPFHLDNFTYDGKTNYSYGLSWQNDSQTGALTTWFSGWGGIKVFTGNQPRMMILNNGNVGIGTLNPQSLLAVKGTVTAQKVVVTQTGWADYVFDSSYNLKSLSDVEQFVKTNKHLPDVPSAKNIEEKGNDLGNNQKILLQKIEELTLYLIEQNKKLNDQQETIQILLSQQKDLVIQAKAHQNKLTDQIIK